MTKPAMNMTGTSAAIPRTFRKTMISTAVATETPPSR